MKGVLCSNGFRRPCPFDTRKPSSRRHVSRAPLNYEGMGPREIWAEGIQSWEGSKCIMGYGPPVDIMTYTTENITFPSYHLRGGKCTESRDQIWVCSPCMLPWRLPKGVSCSNGFRHPHPFSNMYRAGTSARSVLLRILPEAVRAHLTLIYNETKLYRFDSYRLASICMPNYSPPHNISASHFRK